MLAAFFVPFLLRQRLEEGPVSPIVDNLYGFVIWTLFIGGVFAALIYAQEASWTRCAQAALLSVGCCPFELPNPVRFGAVTVFGVWIGRTENMLLTGLMVSLFALVGAIEGPALWPDKWRWPLSSRP